MAAIFNGGASWTLADYYAAAVNALPGEPVGFTSTLLCRVDSQAVASTTRRPFGQRGAGNPGWCWNIGGTNTGVSFGLGNAGGASASPNGTIAAADVGRLLLFTGVWEGHTNTIRLYFKRAQVGAGTNVPGGYAPDTAVAPMIGRRATDGASDGMTIFGVTYAAGIATLAQVQAQHDAVMATESIQHVPGLPGVLIDLTKDVGTSGALPATLTDRGTGGVNFSKVGAPTLAPHYARAWCW